MSHYIVVKVIQDQDEFEAEVNAKIKEGYVPLGGVSLHTDPTSRNDEFCQAMVLKEVLE